MCGGTSLLRIFCWELMYPSVLFLYLLSKQGTSWCWWQNPPLVDWKLMWSVQKCCHLVATVEMAPLRAGRLKVTPREEALISGPVGRRKQELQEHPVIADRGLTWMSPWAWMLTLLGNIKVRESLETKGENGRFLTSHWEAKSTDLMWLLT